MRKVFVAGELDAAPASQPGTESNATVLGVIRIGADRAAGGPPTDLSTFPAEALVEAQFSGPEGNYIRMLSMREVEELATRQSLRGDDLLHIGIDSLSPAQERGAFGWALKALRILDVNPAAKTAAGIARHYDRELVSTPGVFTVADADLAPRERVSSALDGDGAMLVFIHGTASNTQGSFGKLNAQAWRTLRERYGDRILALEHHTLARSPLQNLTDLLELLPRDARLHVVSHSRGGLVGELLCRGRRLDGDRTPFDKLDLGLFSDRADQLAELRQLGELLADRAPHVERFVRVACPAGGTTLASGRLDRALEIMFNAIAATVPGGLSPIVQVLKEFLLDVKKQSANAQAMPGLEAMVPGSPLVRILNRTGLELDADLSVIAGDIEGSGLLARLGVFASDLLYREDHDLVVHTRAMYGGARRSGDSDGARFFFARGAEINHFRYFENRKIADLILRGLGRGGGEQAAGFTPLDPSRRTAAAEVRRGDDEPVSDRDRALAPSPDMPIVFVVPGIMGSKLDVEGKRIWIDPVGLAFGAFAKLAIGTEGVRAADLVGSAYARVLHRLSLTHRVVPFPYDWRLPIEREAQRLARALREALVQSANHRVPVRILAHSMGGLVARAALGAVPPPADEQELLALLQARDGFRFVMAGTPNAGSHTVPRVLLGQDALVRALALVDFRHDQRELLALIAQFQGLIDMLPRAGGEGADLLDASTWTELSIASEGAWAVPSATALEKARSFHARLDESAGELTAEHVCYVAGIAPSTANAVSVDGTSGVQFTATADGDGRVPWGERQFLGLPTWYMHAAHGDLLDTPAAFGALEDLLTTGVTQQLAATPPATRDVSAGVSTPLPADLIEVFPDAEDLERFALGRSPVVVKGAPTLPQLRVRVTHGSLAFCEVPVAVGHYAGDGLYSAEKYLDGCLGGALSIRHDLGVYPGALGSSEVFLTLQPGRFLPGAIVVGLGAMGELNPGSLQETLTLAFIQYALRERHGRAAAAASDGGCEAEAHGALSIASLLIGSGDDGVLPQDSVKAIVEAVLEANRRLLASSDTGLLYIGELQLVELYRETAVEAVLALKRALESWDSDDANVSVAPVLDTQEGGRRRVHTGITSYFWPRIYARSRADGVTFTVPTNRARVEDSLLAVDLRAVQQMVTGAINASATNSALPSALFELLIPNRLKDFHEQFKKIVLVVDEQTSVYPWELLRDARGGGDAPLGTSIGLIRKFATARFEERVRCPRNARALIIGNPRPTDFSNLPGAADEARAVSALMSRNGFLTTALIDEQATSSAVLSALMPQDFQILHLAGHGVFDHRQEHADGQTQRVTGMVIGPGVFLSAEKVMQLRSVPELVFINCCHLGRAEDGERTFGAGQFAANEFAASISKAFIERGALAVVAAGWAVDDAAARRFAQVFYQRMLAGHQFGEAVLQARKAVYDEFGSATNTWGAYQAYGEPEYQLVLGKGMRTQQRPHFVDTHDLVVYIDNLMQDSKTATLADVGRIAAELDALVESTTGADGLFGESKIVSDACVLEALGRAYGEIHEFEKAVHYLGAAVTQGGARIAIETVEQWLNFRARLAASGGMSQAAAKKEIEDALKLLLRLGELELHAGEHHALIGSAWKRMAMLNPRDTRALKNAYDAYAAQSGGEPPGYYAGSNMLLLQGLRYWRNDVRSDRYHGRNGARALDAEQRRLEATIADDWQRDFWSAISHADLALACAVVRGNLADQSDAIAEAYLSVVRHFGSRRELLSVLDQVRTVELLARNPAPAQNRAMPANRRQTLTSTHAAAGKLLRTLESHWGVN